VLLVEDEPLVRDAARRALAALGYTVLAAADGVEAVELFRAQHADIDVVLLDMVMPRMGGRATYRALREIDPDVRVVLTTGYARNEEAEGILELGVRHLLEKPYRVEALAEILRGLVGERASRRLL
jgi:CheY-like chemotaxis protein